MKALWKGALSFGLIHIPVQLFSASKGARELKFKLLHKKDLGEIRYARICKTDGKEVPWEEIVKGYEIEKGDFVILTEEDFQKIHIQKTKTIEILEFVQEDEIDAIYYDTPYYIEPEKGAIKAYVLLREALGQSKKVAVGRFVFKQHEHVGVIRPHENMLVLQKLRYKTELVSAPKVEMPKKSQLAKQEIKMALHLIEQLTRPFQPKEFHDTYTDELKAIIKKKGKGKKISTPQAEVKESKVHDIMSLLKESLEKQKKKSKTRVA
jgi:DNA end-binding protein Ku